jgi:hypothetical protein
MKSIPKHKKDSKNKSISKPKNNLKTIEIETSSKFKNELFQKLFDNYNASKERVNTYSNNRHSKFIRPSPKSTRFTQKIVFKNRNPSYIENLKKSRKRLQTSNPKIENITYTNINPNSTYVIKSKKPSKSNNAKKKLKDYPNLIKGVLRQVNYYNLNNNINYNDNIRYKPIDDFYNEQSSIFIKNIIENNISNTSINLDEQKSELQSNNNNIFNPKNSNDNYNNNIQKIKNNEEDESLEQEIKSNKVKYRRSRGENNIKSIKNISPISPIKIRNIYRNDIPYLNEDIYNDNSDNNIKNNYNRKPSFINNNETIVTDDDDNFKNKKKDKLVITSTNFCLKNESIPKKESVNKSKIKLSKENVNDFTLLNTKKNPIKNIKLEEKPVDSFNIIQKRKNNAINQNNFNNLKTTNLPMINYIGVFNKKSDNVTKEPPYENNGGKLSFNNDDEVIRYIKKKIREEKDLQYNNNKMKYNYFNLIKMFHGKKLYEIGLENNLDKINTILEKENVEIEHEPIMFIFKKDLNKIKNGEIILKNNSKNNPDNNEEIQKLIKEKEKIINENEKLKKRIELMNNINSKNNLDETNKGYDKLLKEIEKLNEQNNEKQNMLSEYEKKMKQYNQIVEANKVLQVEKEKYTKYIIELQEYNEKIIIEYNKMKAQLESALKNKKSNNNFNSNELDIISADFFELINTNKNKSINNINNITFEEIQNEELNDQNNFGDEGYDKNKITIRQSFDSNQKETIHTIKDNNDINADITNIDDNSNSNKKSIKDYLNMNKYKEDKNINNEEEIIVDDDININNINNKFNDGKINNDEEIIEDNLNINANLEKSNIEDEKNNDSFTNNKKKHVNFSDKDSNSIKDESRDISPKKKDESMFRALQRIKNKRKIDEKNNKEKKVTRKSERISGLAKMLEKKLNENPSHNPLYNDLRNDENNVDNDEDPDDNEMY